MVAFIKAIALLSLFSLPQLISLVLADDCACGYKTDDTSVYTEIIESDFTQIKNAPILSIDWQIQTWKISLNTAANIPYNRIAQAANVIPGDTSGLQMLVKAVNGQDVGVSEVRTQREDIKYGSFRVKMQTTKVNGTCSAFFWVSTVISFEFSADVIMQYQNDTREIDIEILSRQVKTSGSPPGIANFVIHSPDSAANNFDASKTDTFTQSPLTFNPTESFHEYRMDWKPNTVEFAVDNVQSCAMSKNVPQTGGRIFLNHWSDGGVWSGAPPTQDATVIIQSVRLYFNSSDPIRVNTANMKCQAAKKLGGGNVCDVSNSDSAFILPPPTTSSTTVTGSVIPMSTRSTTTISRGANAARSPKDSAIGRGLTAVVLLIADALLSFF
jgi:beta-glucanase (GH16 family)